MLTDNILYICVLFVHFYYVTIFIVSTAFCQFANKRICYVMQTF